MAFRTFICWYGRPGETPPDEVMARYNLIVGRACPSERRAALRNLSPDIRFIVYRNAIDCRLAAGIEDIAPSPTGRRAPEHAECGYEDIPRARRDCLLKNRGALRNASRDPRTIYTWGYQQPYDATSRHANRFFLDPRSAWKDVYPELCAESVRAGGYDGVFCDNAGAHIEWIFEGLPDDLKPDIDDEQWARAMADLLTGVARRLTGEKPGALVFANTCGDFVSDEHADEKLNPSTAWGLGRRGGHIPDHVLEQRSDPRGDG